MSNAVASLTSVESAIPRTSSFGGQKEEETDDTAIAGESSATDLNNNIDEIIDKNTNTSAKCQRAINNSGGSDEPDVFSVSNGDAGDKNNTKSDNVVAGADNNNNATAASSSLQQLAAAAAAASVQTKSLSTDDLSRLNCANKSNSSSSSSSSEQYVPSSSSSISSESSSTSSSSMTSSTQANQSMIAGQQSIAAVTATAPIQYFQYPNGYVFIF